jgi:hypothetical protein
MPKVLRIADYRCDVCGLPSSPGICHLCRIPKPAVAARPPADYRLVVAIGCIAVAVLVFGLWMAAQN